MPSLFSSAPRIALLLALLLTALSAHTATSQPGTGSSSDIRWGTFFHPFAPNSLWNSRPTKLILGSTGVPEARHDPMITKGKWSTGVFLAKAGDPPITIKGAPGTRGVWDADAETFGSIYIPHWPSDVTPDAEGDGHADIVDEKNGIIHSFLRLRLQHGQWQAAQYAWSRLNGNGWGDPAHFFQGARATGIPAMAGLIRKHEINDGLPHYRHALAMSLNRNALSASTPYVFPATSADSNAATSNTGQIPQGALFMLPATFDASKINNLALRKIAETLKLYGAYVVDRNHETPYVIYVENGADLSLTGSRQERVRDLHTIRQELRQVISADSWIDGDQRPFIPNTSFNILSMRGKWNLVEGAVLGRYDTWSQSVVFPLSKKRNAVVNRSLRVLHPVSWALPSPGLAYRLTARATGGGKFRLQLIDKTSAIVKFDSTELSDGQAADFVWPEGDISTHLLSVSGIGNSSTVRAELLRVSP